VKGAEGGKIEVIDPATEKLICSVHEATEKDVDIAVSAARKAFEGEWSRLTPEQRGRLMVKLSDLMERDADTLAALESLDNGKAKGVAAMADVPMAYGCIRYYGGWADKIDGKVIDTNAETLAYTKQEAVSTTVFMFFWANYLTCIDRRLWSNHSMELPPPYVGMEDWSCHCMW
jgi:aldehyde dehydrogenase (NAD+)